MSIEFLWTDACFLILLSLSLIGLIFSLRKYHTRQAISEIGHKPIAVSAGIVILVFLIIGILDSIHLPHLKNQSQHIDTLLDKIIYPIGSVYEKTYSAPLALNLFVAETQWINGVSHQIHSRLKFVPASIKDHYDKMLVIHSLCIKALLYSGLLILGLYSLMVLGKRWSGSQKIFFCSSRSLSVLITLGLLFFIIYLIHQLSLFFHVLGTGQIGQDILYLSIKSIHTGLVIGLLTTLVMLPLALFLGIAAGYFGGIVDDLIQYCYTTLSSIPGVLLITASVLSLQIYISNHPLQFNTLAKSADARLLALCFILGVTSWTSLCRLLRAETLKLREMDYVIAAKALGSSWLTIIRKHLLPNVMHIVIITLVLDLSFLVMAEALLSYVGVGVSPMTISWGNMINGARLELGRDPIVWWPISAAFLFMFLLVLAINLFADAVKDALDPYRGSA